MNNSHISPLVEDCALISDEQFWRVKCDKKVSLTLPQTLAKKLGAVEAIDTLLGTATTQSEAMKQTFAKHLSEALWSNTDYRLLKKVQFMDVTVFRLGGGCLSKQAC